MTNPELIKKIKDLKSIKPRPEFKEYSREVLLSQARMIESAQPVQKKSTLNWGFYFRAYKDMVMHKTMQPAVGLLMLLGLVLGSSLTVNAAFYSLPGNTLYPVKIGLERTQLAMVRDEVSRAELKIQFAKKRVEELDQIVAQTTDEPEVKAEKIDFIVKKIKKEVESVRTHIQKMDQDSAPVFKIAISIDSATSQLAEVLNESAKDLTDESKAIVEDAADEVEEASISALETLVGVATSTVNAEIGETDISDSLNKKIRIVKEEAKQLLDINKEDEIVINALVGEAELDVEGGSFENALEKITEIKDLIKDIKSQVEEEVKVIEGKVPPIESTNEDEVDIEVQQEPTEEETEETTIEVIEE